MIQAFKKFAFKGNLIDLAIAVIMGTAFGKVINSFVSDVIMPPIGLLLGGINFNNLYISLTGQKYETLEAAKAAGIPTINYGLFISTLLDFTLVAFTAFLLLRYLSKAKTKVCPECFSDIKLEARRCPHCTAVLTKQAAA